MSKKNIIIIIVISLVLVLGLTTYSLWYYNSPKSVIENTFKADEADIKKYLTDDFIAKINKDSPSNQEFLDSSVSNYSVKKKVENIIISEENDKVVARVVVRTTTTNTKSGFSVVTRDIYSVELIKEANNWKINNYEILESKTLE